MTRTEYRYSQDVQPGMIVDVDGHSFPVERVTAADYTVEYFSNGATMTVPFGKHVKVLGYFNP
jgi:hypothetical protein